MKMRKYKLLLAVVLISMSLNTNVFADVPSDYRDLEYTGLGSYTSAGQTVDKYYQWEKDTSFDFDFYKLKATSDSSIANIITKEIDYRMYEYEDLTNSPGWTSETKSLSGTVFSDLNGTANAFAPSGIGIDHDKISTINAKYINNYRDADANFMEPVGGAIVNDRNIDKIEGVFIGNYVKGGNGINPSHYNLYEGAAYGGAIYNSMVCPFNPFAPADTSFSGIIKTITGDFIANYVHVQYANGLNLNPYYTYGWGSDYNGEWYIYSYIEGALGGAIANQYGTINKIENSNFVQNGVFSTNTNGDVGGAAIYNSNFWAHNESGTTIASSTIIENILGSRFENNLAYSENGNVYGGTILNFVGIGKSEITNISNSSFSENKAIATNSYIQGSLIANWTVSSSNGQAVIGKIDNVLFTNNTATAGGDVYGTIYSNGKIGSIENSEFNGNSITSTGTNAYAIGGAIANEGTITD